MQELGQEEMIRGLEMQCNLEERRCRAIEQAARCKHAGDQEQSGAVRCSQVQSGAGAIE